MSIQYVDKSCDCTGTVRGPFNIAAGTLNLRVNIDAGGDQDFALTIGSARTVDQIVTELAGLTGGTASKVSVNGVEYLRIRSTSALGASSTIVIGTPSNNAASTLGFVTGASNYHGGTNVNSTFAQSATATRQEMINAIVDALQLAGWIVLSGEGTTDCYMVSQMTPSTQNLRTKIRLTDATTYTRIDLYNVEGIRNTNTDASCIISLFSENNYVWRVIANKFQVFILGANCTQVARKFAAFGVPYLPSHLRGVTWEAIWIQGGAWGPTDTTVVGTWRHYANPTISQSIAPQRQGSTWGLYNGQVCNYYNTNAFSQIGGMGFYVALTMNDSDSNNKWSDGSYFMVDTIFGWGIDGGAARPWRAVGQLWDTILTSSIMAHDLAVSSIDSHNWWVIGSYNAAANNNFMGSFLHVVP